MKAIIEKLAEIEATAEAIVENAEAQKYKVEKEIQDKRNAFDKQMADETQEKIRIIRAEGEKKMNQVLENERKKNQVMIDNLEKDFEKNHTVYAKEILKQILEE